MIDGLPWYIWLMVYAAGLVWYVALQAAPLVDN
mgnify:CR=1 FL=1